MTGTFFLLCAALVFCPRTCTIPAGKFIFATVSQRWDSVARFSPPGFRIGTPTPGSGLCPGAAPGAAPGADQLQLPAGSALFCPFLTSSISSSLPDK